MSMQKKQASWWQDVEITSEKEYHQATDRLAAELLRDNTPEQLAVIAAQHLIYVGALETRCLAAEELVRAKDEIAHLQDKQLLETTEESQRKLSVKETARIAKVVLEAWRSQNTQKRMPGLNRQNNGKAAAMERARAIAIEKWQSDTAHKIRISQMANEVYGALVDEGFAEWLPGRVARLNEWIKPVAPDHARQGGAEKGSRKKQSKGIG